MSPFRRLVFSHIGYVSVFCHLFARALNSLEKDIVRLADLLGHSSIYTTRIYTMETGDKHFSRLERLHLVMTT